LEVRYAVRLFSVVVSFTCMVSFADAPPWVLFDDARSLVRTAHMLSGLLKQKGTEHAG